MVHNPKHKVHSFRGLLGDGGQDEINLERQNANVAYRIVKLAISANLPTTADASSTVMIWKEEQTSVPTDVATVDFSDPTLLGVASILRDEAASDVIFDNELFSRNIYVTHTDTALSRSCNYYIELEEVPVTASTLMQIKLGTARRQINAKMGA